MTTARATAARREKGDITTEQVFAFLTRPDLPEKLAEQAAMFGVDVATFRRHRKKLRERLARAHR